MTKSFIAILPLLLILFSCSKNERAESNLEKVSLLKQIPNKQAKPTELFELFEYTTLETIDSSLLGSIDKLLIYNENFYILDKAQIKKVVVFSKNGKFIRTIGNIGGGPGEYSHIEDFTIDKSSGNIVILSYPSKILIYNSNGQFLKQKKLTSSALLWNICSHKKGYTLSANHRSIIRGKEAKLIFNYDKNFSLLNKALEVLPVSIPVPPFISKPLFNIGDSVAYFDVFTNQVYLNVNNANTKVIKFDFEGKEVPIDAYVNPQLFFEKQKHYSFFIDAIIAENLIITTFTANGKRHISIMDSKSGELKVVTNVNWFPDKLLLFHNNSFYSSANPATMMEDDRIHFTKTTTNYPLEANSNPVILKFKSNILK